MDTPWCSPSLVVCLQTLPTLVTKRLQANDRSQREHQGLHRMKEVAADTADPERVFKVHHFGF